MNKLNIADWIAFVLVVVGGLNWGLIGFFKYDLVAALFGDMSSVSRIVYGLVGVAAIYVLAIATNLSKK